MPTPSLSGKPMKPGPEFAPVPNPATSKVSKLPGLPLHNKRPKSLLRELIPAGGQVHWVAQISANLLRDEELVDLIAASGGKWVFIGMESIDPTNLADVNKGFNKPGEYAAVLERLAARN